MGFPPDNRPRTGPIRTDPGPIGTGTKFSLNQPDLFSVKNANIGQALPPGIVAGRDARAD